MRNGMPLLDSLPPHRHLYPEFFKIAYGSLLLRRSVRLPPGKRYGVVHSLWCGGYYHWLVESLPRILALEQHYGNDWVPLLPPYRNLRAVYKTTLCAMGYDSYEMMPENVSVKASEIVIAAAPPYTCFSKLHLQGVRERVVSGCQKIQTDTYSPLIYVSRAKARARKVLNEGRVWPMLEKKGFQRVFLEDLSFFQQVSIFQQAKVIVAQHGAGLANLLFMGRNGLVIELQRKLLGNHQSEYARVRRSFAYFNGYYQLAMLNGCAHAILECRCPVKPRKIDTDDIEVDLNQLNSLLEAQGF